MISANTISSLKNSLQKQGITNLLAQNGVVAVVSTESPTLKSEIGYKNTSVARIRQIFGKRLEKYTDAQLNTLKANDVAFFDIIYGGQYGNTAPGDGWKYRGRGYNQLTFKDNYARYGKMIGLDLVKNPDLVNQPDVAAAVLGAYFSDIFKIAKANGSLKSRFGLNDINEVKDVNTAVKVALQANVGWGKNTETSFFQDVYAKALSFVKDNPGKTGIGTILFVAGLFFLGYNYFSNANNSSRG